MIDERFIGVLGPDGAGKSTLIKGLTNYLESKKQKVHYFHWRIPWFKSDDTKVSICTDPHAKPPYGMFLSVIKLIYLLFIAWPAWLKNAWPHLCRKEWVILDRGPDDLCCDPRRYRYGGPIWLAQFWARLMPRPEKIIVVTADPESIATRKLEVSKEELARQIMQYKNLSSKKYLHVCSSSLPEDTLENALKLLFEDHTDFT